MITINKTLFILGISLALIGGFLMWNAHILGENARSIAPIIGIVGIGLIGASAALGKYKKTPMEQENKKPNKPMFWIGIAIVAITVILLLIGGKELRIWPIPIGIMGIVFIGTSRYRPLKKLF
jgi:FtsH-binding integral membrane protein